MKLCITIIIAICLQKPCVAQDSLALKKIAFKITIADFDKKETRGWLTKINDSAIQFSLLPQRFTNKTLANNNFKEINYSQLSEVTLKRNLGAGRGALIGAITGLVIGVVAGFVSGDDPHVSPDQDFFGLGEAFRMTAEEKALLEGVAGGAAGCGVGAIIGAFVKMKFIIGGKKERFDEMRINVLDRAYRK